MTHKIFSIRFSLLLVMVIVLIAGVPCHDVVAGVNSYSSERSSFPLLINGQEYPYRICSVFLLPGEEVSAQVPPDKSDRTYTITASQSFIQTHTTRSWSFKAPLDPGISTVLISEDGTGKTVKINVFVLVPFERVKKGQLNSYLIGEYPLKPFLGRKIYEPPRGFVEVTRENENIYISPHFQLKQFLCKQESSYPKYLVLREKLLLKLELLLEKVNENGIAADSFFVMSGYRTPAYNRAIGNVMYSRHLWGGAADIYIDQEPRDGYMDDLNRDGVINYKDAKVLYDTVHQLSGKNFYIPFIGGLGLYLKTKNHGPYIHVDVRGTQARW
ncbi:D-Ala-D-Ala carboxypeptidase family metallohydrolase [bacterium]|nr:D-Ala-D-Ala carboxypeptidase family metallohydrolase [bacterium]